MSKIEELIQQYCPNGVEFKKLGDVFNISRGRVMSKEYLRDNTGIYPVYSSQTANNGEIGKIGTYDFDGEYLTWTTDGANAGTIFYRNAKFSVTNVCGLLKANSSEILSKFVYYILCVTMKRYVSSGMGNPKLMSNVVANIQIPVPPLPIQQEIVSILDKFTQLEAELEAELEARRTQYKFYRDQLLNFEGKDVEWKTLGEVGKICMCKRVMKNETKPEGDIPFYKIGTFGKEADAYISNELYNDYLRRFNFPRVGEVLISASGTIGRTVIYDGKPAYFQDSNIVWISNDESIVTNKFLFYYYKIVEWKTDGGTISRLYNDNLAKTKIPIPPIAEQERIVGILDKFDALVNDISVGLPAEIEARRKQYEHYRGKLLNFKELSNG